MNTYQPAWSTSDVTSRLQAVLNKLQTEDHYQSIFTQVFSDADHTIKAPASYPNHPLAGSVFSVKDLFDVKGYTAKAGTKYRRTLAPASNDAVVVQRLKSVGSIAIGHTNMTELAYSGLGINPHSGTPENACYPGCIPGGSTSGGALSLAHQLADIALGTDTGGSLRIPAAFNGIVGFKPTQRSVPLAGCLGLSGSLDSAGPMARDVTTCQYAYTAIADTEFSYSSSVNPALIIPSNFGLLDLDPIVETAFNTAISILKEQGIPIERGNVPLLDTYASLPVWHFSAVESRAIHDKDYREHFSLIDPRVSSRMARADEVNAIQYRQTLNLRSLLIAEFSASMQDSWLIMPTVPILPPKFDSLESDDAYYSTNLQVLRNPSIANVLDGCSISIPYKHRSDVIGIMLIAPACNDERMLTLAKEMESIFQTAGVD